MLDSAVPQGRESRCAQREEESKRSSCTSSPVRASRVLSGTPHLERRPGPGKISSWQCLTCCQKMACKLSLAVSGGKHSVSGSYSLYLQVSTIARNCQPRSLLDLEENTKGMTLSLPKVLLMKAASPAPIPVASMTIYLGCQVSASEVS